MAKQEEIVEVEEIKEENGNGDKAIVHYKADKPINWKDTVENAQLARKVRQEIIQSVMVEGEDFGEPFQGSKKKVLLKPGAEKITDAFELYTDFEILKDVENWDMDDPLFYYMIKCLLRRRGTDEVVATGVGSCNIREPKYWWREQQPECPMCHENTIRLGKDFKTKEPQYYCWQKKGGCGFTFGKDSPMWKDIENQSAGKIRNPDIFDQVNTVLKMAKKRAHVDAVLNFGFSDKFTQDLEDMGGIKKPDTSKPAKRDKVEKDFDKVLNAVVDHQIRLRDDKKSDKFWATARKFGINQDSSLENMSRDKFGAQKLAGLLEALKQIK